MLKSLRIATLLSIMLSGGQVRADIVAGETYTAAESIRSTVAKVKFIYNTLAPICHQGRKIIEIIKGKIVCLYEADYTHGGAKKVEEA